MLYEVTVRGAHFGGVTINRFNYLRVGTPAAISGSLALIFAMGYVKSGAVESFNELSLLYNWQRTVSNTYRFDAITARAVYSVSDFYELPFATALTGASSGAPASPALAYSFRSSRVRSDIRRGYKRFAGVEEANMLDGGLLPTTGTFATYLRELGLSLGATLTYNDEGNTITYLPVIVGKQKVNVGGPDNPRYVYRYYPTLTEQLDHIADGAVWDVIPHVTTIRSRQYGY